MNNWILIAFFASLAQNIFAFYSPEQGRWQNRDPIEEDGGYNLYLFAENNVALGIDPLGLKVRFQNFVPGEGGGRVARDFEPTEEQKQNFNEAVEALAKSSELGKAFVNYLRSENTEVLIIHSPGEVPNGMGPFNVDRRTGIRRAILDVNMFKPAVELDLGKAKLCPGSGEFNSDEDNEHVRNLPINEIPANGAILLGHELGHALIGFSDPENVHYVENLLRSGMGIAIRDTYRRVNMDQHVGGLPEGVPEKMADVVRKFVTEWLNE